MVSAVTPSTWLSDDDDDDPESLGPPTLPGVTPSRGQRRGDLPPVIPSPLESSWEDRSFTAPEQVNTPLPSTTTVSPRTPFQIDSPCLHRLPQAKMSRVAPETMGEVRLTCPSPSGLYLQVQLATSFAAACSYSLGH